MPASAFTAIQPPPEPGQQGCWHRGARRASPTTCGRWAHSPTWLSMVARERAARLQSRSAR